MSTTSLPNSRFRGMISSLLTLPIFLGLLLMTGSAPLAAAQLGPLVLDGNPNSHQLLLPHSEVLADPRNEYSAPQVFASDDLPFELPTNNNPRFSAKAGTYWFKFSLQNSNNRAQRYWLNLDNTRLEHITVFQRDEPQASIQTGESYVNPNWDYQERLHVANINLQAGEIAEFLLRIESSKRIHLAPELYSEHAFILHSDSRSTQLGILLGVLIALLVFSLNLYISLRDKLIVVFMIHICAIAVLVAWSHGGLRLLFPGNGFVINYLPAAGSLVAMISSAFFVRYFLRLPENNPTLDKLVLASALIPVVMVVAIPLSVDGLERTIVFSFSIALFINTLVSGYRLTQGDKPAAFILVANLVLLIPTLALRIIPDTYLPIIIPDSTLSVFSVLKTLIYGGGLSSLVDTLNKNLSREVAERKNRESQLTYAQQIARFGDWSWNTGTNQFVFSESALEILPALATDGNNDLDKLLQRASTRERRKLRAEFGNAARNQQGFDAEFSVVHDNGTTHFYLTRAEFQRDQDGNLTPVMIGTIRDITEYKLADMAYRENEQRWRDLADSTFEAILIFHDDVIIDANQACEQLLGFSPTELIGSSGEDIVSVENLHSLLTNVADAADKPVELTLRHKSGEDASVEIRSRSGSFNQRKVQIVAVRDITERKLHEQQLRQLGYYDSLTGLANRTLFQERLQHAIDKSRRYSQTHALLFIDLDQFKHVNDSLGHEIGDQLLIEVAKRLSERVRKEDTVARLGGDEFAILVEDISAPYAAAKVAEEILKIMSANIEVDDYRLMVTPSIGIALYPSDGNSGGELLRKADTAMYHAKGQGRNNYQFYTEALNEKIVRRMDLESELRLAAERQEFTLNYQPKVDLTTGNIVGAEALLRWNSGKFGLVPPDEFIPIAEETGLIWPIGELVLEFACRQALGWLASHPTFVSIAVNISGNQFNQSNLVETVARVLNNTGLPARHLELEITESAIINNAEEAIKTMIELKALGVRLSLDDFGTGFSSLNYLKRFPVDCLKIDRSFVAEIVNDKTGQLIADNIVKLAHDLDLNVVAEGVETEEQLHMIREMGCDELQGYIFSKPLPCESMDRILADNSNLYKDRSPSHSAGNL